MIINRIFVAKVFKLLALIDYSYRNFPFKRAFKKKVEALETALLYMSLYVNAVIRVVFRYYGNTPHK